MALIQYISSLPHYVQFLIFYTICVLVMQVHRLNVGFNTGQLDNMKELTSALHHNTFLLILGVTVFFLATFIATFFLFPFLLFKPKKKKE